MNRSWRSAAAFWRWRNNVPARTRRVDGRGGIVRLLLVVVTVVVILPSQRRIHLEYQLSRLPEFLAHGE